MRHISSFIGLALAGFATAAAAAPNSISILISGNPSSVRLERPLFGSPIYPPCILFRVTALRASPTLRITTVGLGASQVAEASGNACPARDGEHWRSQLPVSLLGRETRLMALKVDPRLARSEDLADGQIVVFDWAGGRESASIKIGATKTSALFTAFQWFLGLLVPAIIAFALGQLAIKLQKRRSERETFDAFRELQAAKIAKACAELSVAFASNMDHPGQFAYQVLLQNGVLDSLPAPERRTLTRYCRKDDKTGIVVEMHRHFPSCRDSLSLTSG